MSWYGALICLKAIVKPIDLPPNSEGLVKSDIYWEIIQLIIPPELETKKEEIASACRDAIDEYGMTYDRRKVNQVHITFANISAKGK